MEEIYSVEYIAYGETEFVLPFVVKSQDDIMVWIGTVLQTESAYTVMPTDPSGSKGNYKIVFQQPVGEIDNPQVVCIYKEVYIERKTDFKNFTTLKAEYLNLEFNNILNILKYLKSLFARNIPKFYHNINPQPSNHQILVDDSTRSAKSRSIQEFNHLLDKCIVELGYTQKTLNENTANLNLLQKRITADVIPDLAHAQDNIRTLQEDITQVKKEIVYSVSSSVVATDNSKFYTIERFPIVNNKINFLQKSQKYARSFDVVNLSKTNPLILNFANKHSTLQVVLEHPSQIQFARCTTNGNLPGRYYIVAEVDTFQNNTISLSGCPSKPYFSYHVPTLEELRLHGVKDTNLIYYFVMSESSFYVKYGDVEAPCHAMYLGYYEVGQDGKIISEPVYIPNVKSFTHYIDAEPNQVYHITNLTGSNLVNIELYAIMDNGFLLPVCNQAKLNSTLPNVVEMGINYQYNLEEIVITTASQGICGYYKGAEVIGLHKAKIKLVVTRLF